MSDKPKGIQEGPPIWVESILTREQWKARCKIYQTSNKPESPEYDETCYKGGKWRAGMGNMLNEASMMQI